jgi:Flp pilus assembly pilin Flp
MLYLYLRLRNGAAAMVRGREGQTLTEYALIMMLIALVVIMSLVFTGSQLSTLWSQVSSRVGSAAA